jgi:hypothetical protein
MSARCCAARESGSSNAARLLLLAGLRQGGDRTIKAPSPSRLAPVSGEGVWSNVTDDYEIAILSFVLPDN